MIRALCGWLVLFVFGAAVPGLPALRWLGAIDLAWSVCCLPLFLVALGFLIGALMDAAIKSPRIDEWFPQGHGGLSVNAAASRGSEHASRVRSPNESLVIGDARGVEKRRENRSEAPRAKTFA